MVREKVLIIGDSNTGKTSALVALARLYPERTVVIFDPDDGTSKALTGQGITHEQLPNLMIYPVRSDWQAMLEYYQACKAVLREGDWLCFDMLGRFWDLVQQYYSIRVFGQNPIEHLLALRSQAQKPGFGGFDGLQDWSLIKRLHNELLMDDAVLYSRFNVMATTGVTTYMPMEKVPQKGVEGLLATQFGIKPVGEKHNIYRFDTVAITYRDPQTTGFMFKLVKDRGREVDISLPHNMQGSDFWTQYRAWRGIE